MTQRIWTLKKRQARHQLHLHFARDLLRNNIVPGSLRIWTSLQVTEVVTYLSVHCYGLMCVQELYNSSKKVHQDRNVAKYNEVWCKCPSTCNRQYLFSPLRYSTRYPVPHGTWVKPFHLAVPACLYEMGRFAMISCQRRSSDNIGIE